MDDSEIMVFFLSSGVLFWFLMYWYGPLFNVHPNDRNDRNDVAKIILGSLPVIFLLIMFVILNTQASFDVVDSAIYQIFYIVLGYALVSLGLYWVSVFFGLIWPDDAVHLNNKAALLVTIGIFFALTAIYVGSNIGDGPGWWCVLFSGSLGFSAWFILGFMVHSYANIFERITVERDLACGLRFSLYLILSGIILGYACSGNWQSFAMTVKEFNVGWPVLPLAAIFILIEFFYKQKTNRKCLP